MKTKVTTDLAPAAIGPYSQGVISDGVLYTSGQIGLDPYTGEFVGADTVSQAKQVFANLDAILAEAGFSRNDVVKVSVLFADLDDFVAVNEVYAEFFKDVAVLPARSAFAVASLPKQARVEIELVAEH
jgi:2-iminobutanoate/2-iminopropanoate deaminase